MINVHDNSHMLMHTGAYGTLDNEIEEDDCKFCDVYHKQDEYNRQVGKLLKIHEVFTEGNL